MQAKGGAPWCTGVHLEDCGPYEIQLHRHITPNPLNPHIAPLQWDLYQMPPTARHYSARHNIARANLDELATSPVTNTVTIDISDCSRHPLLAHWGTTISIDKSALEKKKSYITIGDILYAMYEYFQIPMTHVELLAAWGSSGENLDSLQRSLKTRCSEVPGIPEVEWRQGFRRVDILGEYRFFYGMIVQNDLSTSGTWKLKPLLGPSYSGIL